MIMFRPLDPGVDFGTPPLRISGAFLCRKRVGRSTARRKSPSLGLSSALSSLGGILPQLFVLGELPGKAYANFSSSSAFSLDRSSDG